MNRPTDQVEELFLLSQEAVACDDSRQAAVFLRRALELAPLRKDLRAALARVVAREDDNSGSGPEPLEAYGNGETEGSHWGAQAAVETAPTRSAMRTVPSTAMATVMRGSVGSGAVSSGSRQPGYRPRVSVRTEGNVNLHLDDDPVSFSDPAENPEISYQGVRTSLHRLLEDDEEDEPVPMPKPAAPRKRRGRARLIQQSSSIEDWIAIGFERSIAAIRETNPARFGYACCYVALAVFVAAACYQTRRVFGEQKSRVASAKVAQPAKTEVQQASMAPSLFSIQGPTSSAKTEAEILTEGREHLAAGRFDQAISTFEPALQSGTRTVSRDLIRQALAQAYDSKATADLQQSEFANAIKLYRQAANLAPGTVSYQVHLANALYYSGVEKNGSGSQSNLEEAVRIATGIVHVDPQNLNAYQVLATSEESLGHKAAAKSAWQRVLSLAGKTSSARKKALAQIEQLKGA